MHSLAYGQAMAAAARDYQKVCYSTMACLAVMCALVSRVETASCMHSSHEEGAGCVNIMLLMQEMLSESRAPAQSQGRGVDVDDLLDDPELERLHAERLATMQREAEKRVQLQQKGHGELQEVCVKASGGNWLGRSCSGQEFHGLSHSAIIIMQLLVRQKLPIPAGAGRGLSGDCDTDAKGSVPLLPPRL